VLSRFRYTEHPENIALALAVCDRLGVDRDTALEGMVALAPEDGATRVSRVGFFDRDIVFVQAFAANDPSSTRMIWERMVERYGEGRRKIVVVNCRMDRPDRSRQFAEMAGKWSPPDAYVVTGGGAALFVRHAVANGVPAHHITMLEGATTSQFANHLLAVAGRKPGPAVARGHAGMCNLIGEIPAAARTLDIAGTVLHDYGKSPRPGRKLGHITVVADTAAERDEKLAAIGKTVTGSTPEFGTVE